MRACWAFSGAMLLVAAGVGAQTVPQPAAAPQPFAAGAPLGIMVDGRHTPPSANVRVIGSIAITLAYVAAGRLDGMLSARPCRSVDAAAAQLLVSEAGGAVEFAGFDLDDATLGLDARYAVLAARNTKLLSKVRSAQERSPDA